MIAAMPSVLPTAIPQPRFWKHGEEYRELGQAGRDLLDILFVATGFAEHNIKIRDRDILDIAKKIVVRGKRGFRWVQKGLRQLLGFKPGESEPTGKPWIEKGFHYGPREECGRMIKIIAPEMQPQPKPEPKPSKPRKAKRAAGKATPLTPEEAKAHADNLASAAAEAQPADDPAPEGWSPSQMWAAIKTAAEAEAAKPPEEPKPKAPAPMIRNRRSIFDTLAKIRAEHEGHAADREGDGVASDPSGP